jgi:hypothetical protein
MAQVSVEMRTRRCADPASLGFVRNTSVTMTNTSRDDGELHSSSSAVLRHCCVTDLSPPDQTALRSLIGINGVVDVGDRRRRPAGLVQDQL